MKRFILFGSNLGCSLWGAYNIVGSYALFDTAIAVAKGASVTDVHHVLDTDTGTIHRVKP